MWIVYQKLDVVAAFDGAKPIPAIEKPDRVILGRQKRAAERMTTFVNFFVDRRRVGERQFSESAPNVGAPFRIAD